MGLGIEEPSGPKTAFVPGTSILFDVSNEIGSSSKHVSGEEPDLILVPQPSSSPRDPLVSLRHPRFFIAEACSRIGPSGRRT